MKLNFSIDDLISQSIEKARDDFDIKVDEVHAKVKQKTPEDTKELLQSIKRTEVTEDYEGIRAKVYTSGVDYAPYVEYGVLGRNYNYNKPKGSIFYRGVGAAMFRRTVAEYK